MFGELAGISVVDADKLGHLAYEKGTECYKQVIESFGEGVVSEDGSINRRVLGGIVFGDKDALKRLESIVWPEIRRMVRAKIQEAIGLGNSVFVLEAAVMIEAGWQDLVDKLVVVECTREYAIERLKERNNLSLEEAEKRIDSQFSIDQRRPFADYIIVNESGIDYLIEESSKIYRMIIPKLF